MKKILIILLVLTVGLTMKSYGQSNGSIAFTVGSASPMGDFKSTSSGTSTQAGFATNGLSFELNYRKLFKKNLGLLIQIQSTSNAIDINKVTQSNKLSLQNSNNNISNVTGYGNEVSPYKTTGLFLGGFYNLQISKSISLHPRMLLGFCNTNNSKFDLQLNWIQSGYACSGLLKTYSNETKSFGYQLGCDFLYMINKKLNAVFSLNYFSTKAIKDVTTDYFVTVNGAPVSDVSTFSGTFQYEMLNSNFGLLYQF